MTINRCDCGAATEGKWADIHWPNCPALRDDDGLDATDQAIIDAAWERHKAAAPPTHGVYSRPDCPFNYCDCPRKCRAQAHCRHR